MDVICPICEKAQKSRGLLFHLRNNHPKEYQEIGWRKLKNQARKIPKEAPTPKGEEDVLLGPKAKPPMDKDMAAWYEETQKKLGFFPSPVTLAIIQNFTKSVDPSDFINEAIVNEGKRRGLSAALIKTEGGSSLNLIPNQDTDKDMGNLLKLITAQAQVNQSYNQNSPMIQMMQMMKEKVNNGMGIGQFGKELMQMIMMMKMVEGM